MKQERRSFRNRLLNQCNKFFDRCHFCYSFIYSRLFNKPLIYVIGDSHTEVFRRRGLFIVHHIGASTAYNLDKDNSTTDSKKKLWTIVSRINLNRDIVLLVFGEIDARIHLYNQYMKNSGKITITELIADTVSQYGHVLAKLNGAGVNFYVYGIPPATNQLNVYGYPFYATPDIHKRLYKEFHEQLSAFCKENRYEYIDIYSQVTDGNGFLSETYNADGVHLKPKIVAFVREWLDMHK